MIVLENNKDIEVNINSLFYSGLQKEATVYISNSNTPSRIGYPCDRYLVFLQTRGQDAQPPSLNLLKVFFLGKKIEDVVATSMRQDGFKIEQEQRPLKDYSINLSGKIDCTIKHEMLGSKPLLCEIKSFSPFEYNKYNKQEDFLNSSKFYYRNYYSQVQAYLHLLSKEKDNKLSEDAYIILFNKLNFDMKGIIVKRDDEFIKNEIINKCKRINKYIKTGKLPKCEYNKSVCSDCSFNHVCDVNKDFGNGMVELNDDMIYNALKEMDELEDGYKRYEELSDFVKDSAKNYKTQTGIDSIIMNIRLI